MLLYGTRGKRLFKAKELLNEDCIDQTFTPSFEILSMDVAIEKSLWTQHMNGKGQTFKIKAYKPRI